MTSYKDVTIVCSIFSGKTTVHAQKNHHGLSAHLPASVPNILNIMEIPNLIISFWNPFCACDIYIYIYIYIYVYIYICDRSTFSRVAQVH